MSRRSLYFLLLPLPKALLLLGARPDVKYRGYTPEEYAKRKHRRWGCYDDVLKVFVETMPKILGLAKIPSN